MSCTWSAPLLISSKKKERAPNGALSCQLVLEQSTFGEAQHFAARDDQMIEDPNIDELQRVLEAPRDEFIGG